MVFIQATLPRLIGVGEIVIGAERHLHLSVIGKLFAIIKRNRMKVLLLELQQFNNNVLNNLSVLGWDVCYERLFTDPLSQGD